jgi:hypothetical protein
MGQDLTDGDEVLCNSCDRRHGSPADPWMQDGCERTAAKMSESTLTVPATTESQFINPKPVKKARSWFYWPRFVVCLILVLIPMPFSEGQTFVVPFFTLFWAVIVGPKWSFRSIWQTMSWICVAMSAVNLVIHMYLGRLPSFAGFWVAWLATGGVMWLVPKLFGWSEKWGDHRISRALAWFFGTLAGCMVVAFIVFWNAAQELEAEQERGFLRDARAPSTDGLVEKFLAFALAALIAYRWDWIRQHVFRASRHS